MRAISLPHSLFSRFVAVVGAGVLAACDNPLALPPAQFDNALDTVTMHALRGTAITAPSAFDIIGNTRARTDRAEPFDFAFDIETDGRAVVLPAGALGIGIDAGILVTRLPFDSILSAPLDGYVVDSAVAIGSGTVFVGRSRGSRQRCGLLGALPRYGKFRVLDVDPVLRTLRVETLVNTNCGYRGLEPGLPTS